MNKLEKIIIIVVVIALLIVAIYFALNSGNKYVYYRTKSGQGANTLIEDIKTLQKTASNTGIGLELEKVGDYSKLNMESIFNEEYFTTKKVALIYTYEDTSKSYMYSVDDVKYNKDKTVATIYYTDKAGEYVGPFKNSWYNCMLIELEGTVTDVSFVKN